MKDLFRNANPAPKDSKDGNINTSKPITTPKVKNTIIFITFIVASTALMQYLGFLNATNISVLIFIAVSYAIYYSYNNPSTEIITGNESQIQQPQSGQQK